MMEEMDTEVYADGYEYDHAADYIEEAIRDYQKRRAKERYERLPAMCRRCRWLEMYYVQGCQHWRYPQDGRCVLYLRKFYFRPRWLWGLFSDIQYHIWNWLTRKEAGKFSAPIGTALDDDDLDW